MGMSNASANAVHFSCCNVFMSFCYRFNKDTWKFLGTLDVIAHNGYNYIAFDLPGYGESKEHARVDPQTLLPEVNEKLKLGMLAAKIK